MQLDIDVVSHDAQRDTEDLARWLEHAESELPVMTIFRGDGVSLEARLTSTTAVVDLAARLLHWLGRRRGDREITVRIRRPDGRVVETGTDVEETVSGLVAALTRTSTTGAGIGFANVASAVVHARESGVFAFDDSRAARDESEDAHADTGNRSVPDVVTLPVTIYLSDEAIHEQVETAVEALMALAGLQVESRDEPVSGSWFRRMRATLKAVAHSPAVRESALVAAHVADARLVLAQDAAITATLLQNLGPVLTALQPTKDAVIRVGALVVVKVEWVVSIHQLTAAQQAMLDHTPRLAASPHEIITALNLKPATENVDPAPLA